MRIPKSKSQIRRGGIRRGGGLKLGSVSGWSCATLLLAALCHVTGVTVARAGAGGFCLPDADGDGHPLFGNPEVMLNPIMAVEGPTSMQPTNGAIGDLDADGDLDAVSTWAYKNPLVDPTTNISVLLNRGDATFFEYAIYECGDYPSSVAIGDLDGDGLNDLAVTNVFSGQLSVLINAGGAAFPNRVTYAVGAQPRSSLIADFNADGALDVAIGNAESNDVSILLNTGGGVLAPAVTYPVINIPDDTILFGDPFAFGGPYMAAGDLDGDEDLDIAVPGGADGVSLLLNNGDGSFVAPTAFAAQGAYAWSVAIGDLESDGDMDLATVSDEIVSVAFNQGNGTFAPPVHYSINFTQPGSLHDGYKLDLGDLDHDGDLDLAAGQTALGQVIVMMNQGDGSFGPLLTYPADENEPLVVDFGDLNCDGHLDLAVFVLNSSQTRKLCILLNDGSGALMADQESHNWWAPPSLFWSHTRQISSADLDADLDLDIAVLNQGDPFVGVPGNLVVVRNMGDSVFAEPAFYPIRGFHPFTMVLSDMDGDRDADVVVCGPEDYSQYAPGHVSILLNAGDGSFAVASTYPTGGLYSIYVVLADLEPDGDLDVLTSNYFSSDFSLLVNDGSGVLGAPVLQNYPFETPGFFAVGDINGDRVLDLVVNKAAGVQAVTTMLGNGDGTFAAGEAYYPSVTVEQLLLMDLDGDADDDLVVSGGGQSITFSTLANQGDGTFAITGHYWAPGLKGARVLASADVNADGVADVAVSVNGAVCAFFANTHGAFAPGFCYGSGRGIEGLAAGDLDGDGGIDLGTANAAAGYWNYSILWNRSCSSPNAPGDLDADGDVDLSDFALMASCLAGPDVWSPLPQCYPKTFGEADFDEDGDVDLGDSAQFLSLFEGS